LRRAAASGFTLIELVVVISIVAVGFGVALDRLLRYQELGERAAMEQTLAAINTALTMKFAAWVTSGRPEGIKEELGKNPVDLLSRPPQNYLGELYSPDPELLERGNWYFDRSDKTLVYLPRRLQLDPDAGPPKKLRFRIALTEPKNPPDQPRELAMPFIASVDPFRWMVEGPPQNSAIVVNPAEVPGNAANRGKALP
jgi:general secretion pathway protein G